MRLLERRADEALPGLPLGDPQAAGPRRAEKKAESPASRSGTKDERGGSHGAEEQTEPA